MKITILSLIDQIRMLDNDMIRLQKKLDTVLQLKKKMKDETNHNRVANAVVGALLIISIGLITFLL